MGESPQRLWTTEGGAAYNAVLIAVAFAVSAIGAGDLSLDDALGSTTRDSDGVSARSPSGCSAD